MDRVTLLERATSLGLTITVDGDSLKIRGRATPEAETLVEELRQHKAEVLGHLRQRAQLIDLPFPLGYGGLPAEEVARAEATNDRLGVKDPVERRLNVLSWMRCHYRDRGDVEMARQMREAYHELRHADPSIQSLCGLCEEVDGLK